MQKRLFLAPAAAAIFILYFTVFGERGLLRINHLHRDRDEMQRRFVELKSENDKLKREITALQSDRRYLESIARRDFGFVRSNETIYQFPSQEKAPAPQEKGEKKDARKTDRETAKQNDQQSDSKSERKPAQKSESTSDRTAAAGER